MILQVLLCRIDINFTFGLYPESAEAKSHQSTNPLMQGPELLEYGSGVNSYDQFWNKPTGVSGNTVTMYYWLLIAPTVPSRSLRGTTPTKDPEPKHCRQDKP